MNARTVCRICKTEGVRLHCITNTHLQKMYERETHTLLTNTTDDKKPTLACIECCDRLQHCYQLRNGIEQGKNPATMMKFDPQLRIGQIDIHQNNTQSYVEICVKMEPEQLRDVEVKQESTSDWDNEMLQDIDIKLEKDNQNSDTDLGSEPRMIKVELQEITSSEKMNVSPMCENPEDISRNQKKNDVTRNNATETSCEKATLTETRQDQLERKPNSILNSNSTKLFYTKKNECDICKKCFSRKTHLISHSRTHTGEKPFECDLCKKRFSHKFNLTKHARTHTSEKPFECNVCKKRYGDRSDLAKHTRIHTGEKPFECNVCNKRFSQSGDLAKHIRKHTGERPFECHLCEKCFSDSSSLAKHVYLHSGVKPFECEICKKRFSLKSNYTKHTRIHTG